MSKRQQGHNRQVTAAIDRLESLKRSGVQQLARPRQPLAESVPSEMPPAAVDPPIDVEPGVTSRGEAPSCGEAPAAGDRLATIAQDVAGCRLCDELAATRTQTVFGVGNPNARLCFLGEAPGADEDRRGEPFVGRAGQLLTKIIEACTLERSDVYILNVLKCRPPKNRNPLPQEVANCREFLDRQLAQINPEVICCLGAVAAQTLLETDTTIGRLRGKILEYRGIRVVCTYHPAYLLRNPAAKKDCWDDMKMLMREIGIEL